MTSEIISVLRVRAQPHQITVTLGDYILNSNSEPYPPVVVGVSQIKVHPHFKFTPQVSLPNAVKRMT
jgi:hypothetical protein